MIFSLKLSKVWEILALFLGGESRCLILQRAMLFVHLRTSCCPASQIVKFEVHDMMMVGFLKDQASFSFRFQH